MDPNGHLEYNSHDDDKSHPYRTDAGDKLSDIARLAGLGQSVVEKLNAIALSGSDLSNLPAGLHLALPQTDNIRAFQRAVALLGAATTP